MDPAPPPITIIDPNAPPGYQEVLGSDGGWRPSPYQKLVALLTALIVALLVSGVQRVRHVHHEQSLDSAARRDVALSVEQASDFFTEESMAIKVTNHGTMPVSITGLQLLGEGYREQRVSQRIGPGESQEILLPSSKNCRTELYNKDTSGLRIAARTLRGDRVVQTVQLPGQVTQQLGYVERFRCGFLRPREALVSQLVDAHRVGRDVVVRVSLSNRGVLPLTVSRPEPGRSLTASSSDFPLTLERRAFWTGSSKERTVTLRLRVTDCALFATDSAQEVAYYEEGEYPSTLDVTASNDYREDKALLELFTWDYELDETDSRVAKLLQATCPASFFPRD